MRAFGVAMAACGAMVFWPSTAHANPIGARTCATIVSAAAAGWQALDRDHDADDGAFTARAGLDQSVHFAATGTIDLFDDDHASLGNVIDVEGLLTAAHDRITLALRASHDDGDKDGDNHGQGHAYAYAYGHDKHHGRGEKDRDRAEHGEGGAPSVSHGPSVHTPVSHGPTADSAGGGGLQTSATPEPASILLLATGVAGLVFYRRQLFA